MRVHCLEKSCFLLSSKKYFLKSFGDKKKGFIMQCSQSETKREKQTVKNELKNIQ